ncbi:hypothetical protein BCO37747_06746 [Burkholderia contaminans]|nr:hypothetical protein BCO23253_05373 [Burkholderia contaminans]VWD56598.1 hypothetical protein BCO37747_06746 [Burkholderia contaminans]
MADATRQEAWAAGTATVKSGVGDCGVTGSNAEDPAGQW